MPILRRRRPLCFSVSPQQEEKIKRGLHLREYRLRYLLQPRCHPHSSSRTSKKLEYLADNGHQQGARMPPGAINPSRQQSLVSCNMFSVLPEVPLEGTSFVLPVVSRKSWQRLARRKKRLSTSLHVSAISISPKKVSPVITSVNSKIISSMSLCSTYDLGSDDPITLPCLVNNN